MSWVPEDAYGKGGRAWDRGDTVAFAFGAFALFLFFIFCSTIYSCGQGEARTFWRDACATATAVAALGVPK